jgi:hypothetical protein
MKKTAIFSFLFLFPSICLHADFQGNYNVSGFDPYNESYYTAIASIVKNDDIYTIEWTYPDNSQETGTGFVEDKHLSLVYQGVGDPTDLGVEILKIKHEDQLKGTWLPLGDTIKGYEIYNRIDDSY